MIINRTKRFIFVHIPKVAGTSITRHLEKLPGNNKHWLSKSKHETLAEFEAHFHARRSLLDKITNRTTEGYFTFGFVRNPWDRMSSFYRYLTEARPRKEIEAISSFKDFLTQANDGVEWINKLSGMRPQLDFFTFPDGRMRLSFLGHYEHLEEDIRSISCQIECPIELPHHNPSSNLSSDYRSIYDDNMIELVSLRFKDEISHFGYSFEKRHPAQRCSASLEGLR